MWTKEIRAKYNRDHLRYPSDLTDDEWTRVEPFIPPAKSGGGKRRTGADKRAHSKVQLLNGFSDVRESVEEVMQAIRNGESDQISNM